MPKLTPVDIDPFNVGMSEALPAPQARLRAKELFSDFGKAFMSGLQDSGRAGATSMMEALENQYVPEGAVGINDAGQWTDKQGNPLNVQRRPNIVPLTKTAEGGYEGAMPAMADVWNTMGGVGKAATLGAGPVLRPALKYKDKIYKAKEGQQHLDALPVELQDTFQKMAMSGEDISHFNFGFINHKGHFLQREDALKYAIDNGLLDPNDAKYGTLVTTMLNDSGGGQKVASQAGQALKEKAPTFYSAAEKAVENLNQNKASGEQWINTLSNQKGVKGEELEWTGLKEFLKDKPSVTKQEIQDYLKENKVELKEVWKRSDNKYNYKTHDEWYNAIQVAERRNDWNEVDNLNRAWEASEGVGGVGSPKYSKWQLPGGENYRELLMTLPDKRAAGPKTFDEFAKLNNLQDGPEARRLYSEFNANNQNVNDGGNYRSSHWDEPNILVHVRMNDRTIDGKKSLHLEEIQSDWHQQGRDKGYKSSGDLNRFNELDKAAELARTELSFEAERTAKEAIGSSYAKFLQSNPSQAERTAAQAKIAEVRKNDKAYLAASDKVQQVTRERDSYNPSSKVPDAPFKKTWHELALKRAIREAAENGYERLSWTPGEAQAARYDLSKQVNNIRYKKNVDGTYQLSAEDKSGKGHMLGEKLTEKQLADNVGKEVAEKIIKGEGNKENLAGNNEPRNEWNKLSGLDLKIGGEGMKGFYDQIIPKSISKLMKEYNLKIEKSKTEKGDEIFYIDLPSKTRDNIINKGFPLFSGTPVLFPINYNPFSEEYEK